MPQDPAPWSAFALVPLTLLQDKRLTPTQLRVLIALLGHGNPTQPDRPVWPSSRTLAAETGLSPDSKGSRDKVRQTLHQLAALGYLEIVSAKGAKYRLSLRPLLAARTYSSQVSQAPEDLQRVWANTYESQVSSEPTKNRPRESTDHPPALACPFSQETAQALSAQLTQAGVSRKTAQLSLQAAGGVMSAEEITGLAQRFTDKYRAGARNPSALWWKLVEKCLEDKKQEQTDRQQEAQAQREKLRQKRQAERRPLETARKYQSRPQWSEASQALFQATLAKLKSGFPVEPP